MDFSDAQKSTDFEETISYELLSFVAVFFLFSLFGVIILLVEMDSHNPLFDKMVLEQLLYISIISTVLSLVQLIRYFYKINLIGQPGEKDYSPIRAYQLRGGNVVDFYHLHEKLVLKGDLTYQELQQKYQRNSAYFSFFSILGGIAVVIILNKIGANSPRPAFSLEFVISGLIYLAFLVIMLIRLVKLAKRKKNTLAIKSQEFNQYLDKIGINLHSNPLTRKQMEIREFLELTNFLQNFYRNHFRSYLGSLFFLLIFTAVGMILRFSADSTLLFRRIGFALILISALGFAINHARFMMKRELYLMTSYTLKSYFMLI